MDAITEAAHGLLFLMAAEYTEPPPPIMSMRAKRELKRINDWNGALRQSGGVSGEVRNATFSACGPPSACGAVRARRQCAQSR